MLRFKYLPNLVPQTPTRCSAVHQTLTRRAILFPDLFPKKNSKFWYFSPPPPPPQCLEICRIKLRPQAPFRCDLLCELFSLLPQPEITTEACDHCPFALEPQPLRNCHTVVWHRCPVHDLWMDTWTNNRSSARAVLWALLFIKFCFPPSILNTQLFFPLCKI